MGYYQIFIESTKNGKEQVTLGYDTSEETVKKVVAQPYNKGKSFIFLGEVIKPSEIKIINIFLTERPIKGLFLPDGRKALEVDNTELRRMFCDGVIENHGEHSANYLIPPEETDNQTRHQFMEKPMEKKKIFIVHGREKGPALELKDFLKDTYSLDVAIFDDLKKKRTSPTIIEILEDIMNNAGYAFIVATPDDLGSYHKDVAKCKEELLMDPESINVKSIQTILSKFKTRARQNVVFEHGLFLGALGRDKVCCLLQASIQDKQTDIDGIVYVCFNENISETFPEIVEKLKDSELLIKP